MAEAIFTSGGVFNNFQNYNMIGQTRLRKITPLKDVEITQIKTYGYGAGNSLYGVVFDENAKLIFQTSAYATFGSLTVHPITVKNFKLEKGKIYYIGIYVTGSSFFYITYEDEGSSSPFDYFVRNDFSVYRHAYGANALSANGITPYAAEIGLEYVVSNTAPTIPGAFTQPTGELETGDSKVFSVGASSDAEGNLSKYVWEASINGDSFTKIGETSTNNITYTIPSAKTLKMRVKAADSQGLESAYRESAVFTVTKPKYYWSKYNFEQLYNNAAQFVYQGKTEGAPYLDGYTSYAYDNKNNSYRSSGDPIYISNQPPGTVAYSFGTNNIGAKLIKKYVATDEKRYGETVWDVYEINASNNQLINVKGSLVQSGIVAEEGTYPTDGVQSGFWWVRGSRVNQSIAPPGAFSSPEIGKIFRPSDVASIAFAASSAANLSLYEVDYRYGEGSWNPLTYSKDLTRVLTITTDKALKTIQFRVRAKNTSNVYSDYVYSDVYTIEHNAAPTIELNTPDGTTLYERGILSIEGLALEKDLGNIISVKFKIDNYQAKTIDAKVSDGTTPLTFKKDLTFQQGKFYDKDIAITDDLDPEIPHTLTVWSEDDQGGKSADTKRTFFVVPNRAPVLTVNPIEPKSGLIDADTVIISGTVDDPENDNVSVSYRLNDGQLVEIYNDVPGEWSFEIPLKSLKNGSNQITIEAPDSFGKKAEETVTINKKFNPSKQKKAVVYWKITSSAGSAIEMFAWIQKEFGELGIEVDISMTHEGEQENFVPMTNSNTAPIPANGTEELEFHYEDTEKKENIILKLTLTREDTSINTAIKMLSGVLG